MTKSTITSIIMIGICVLILVGSVFMGYLISNPDRGSDTISVDVGKPSGDTVRFEDLKLIPGKSTDYNISLDGEIEAECEITLKFEEKSDKGLKNYVYARVEFNGENVYGKDMLLADLFKADVLKFPCDFSDGKDHSIKITYYMPLDVSNEAEKAEADFVLHVTASNEE